MKNFLLQKKYTNKLVLAAVLALSAMISNGQILKVAVAGLTHDHVNGLLGQYKRGEVLIVGIAETDQQLIDRHKKKSELPDSIFFKSLTDLLKHVKPDVVLAYNATSEHLGVVEICAPMGLSVMVEKPLATKVKDAERIAALAAQHHVQVLTNYETTWYSSNQQVYETAHEQHAIGDLRKMIVHSGHQGPKAIGCSKEFLSWLTDPVMNGGGAVMDFGCYGANLMTWMMNGKMPIAVTAITKHIQPAAYPKVDDEATILLEYPEATGIIEASWNWPFGIKDFELFGTTGYLHATDGKTLIKRDKNTYDTAVVKPAIYKDNLTYLAKVLTGEIKPANDLSSLENNLVVVKILEAATKSAKEGKRIVLQ
ncbi:MAG: Gfo/Idh/MocA family oxidoreductase [Ferruginibacter sp.]